MPSLQLLDKDSRVIYIGSFSKTLAPGLRLGYVLAPLHLADAFERASLLISMGHSPFVQAALADFIRNGSFARNLRRMTTVYRARRNALTAALSRCCPNGFRTGNPRTGLHLSLIGLPDFDDAAASANLPPDLRAVPLSSLCVSRTDCKGFVLGYASAPPDVLAAAAVRFASSLSQGRR